MGRIFSHCKVFWISSEEDTCFQWEENNSKKRLCPLFPKMRPDWLQEHEDDNVDGTKGWKSFYSYSEDPDKTGRKHHYVFNAAMGLWWPVGIYADYNFEYGSPNPSKRDIKYNRLGRAMGKDVRVGLQRLHSIEYRIRKDVVSR